MRYRPFERYHFKRLRLPIYDSLVNGIENIKKEHPINSVLDIGCSCGVLLNKISCEYKVGIDYGLPERVMDCHNFLYYDNDLNNPPFFISIFDLIICQEVIEHIKSENENNILGLIHSNSKKGTVLIFSGAVPGQKGRCHINCRPVKYWEDKLLSCNFHYNRRLTRLYKETLPKASCYYQNTLVYIKGDK
jgi:hypothetical protein